MAQVCVIADDFTGAAEMAGIAWRRGHRTVLLRDPNPPPSAVDVVVYDASTRSLAPEAASQRIRGFCELAATARVFKKIDSVLRGNVLIEARAAIAALQHRRAIILGQNPSRGRTIAGGVYRIDGVPISRTAFRDDPDHPATDDHILPRLDPAGAFVAACCAEPIAAPTNGLILADADDAASVERWAQAIDDTTLAVGGADLFSAMLPRWLEPGDEPDHALPGCTHRLHICGTASRPPDARLTAVQLQRPTADDLIHLITTRRSVAVFIGGLVERHPGAADRLQRELIDTVEPVVRSQHLDQLLIEGGATSAALFDRLGWTEFELIAELTVGVVALRPRAVQSLTIITKPGSYDWPAMLVIA